MEQEIHVTRNAWGNRYLVDDRDGIVEVKTVEEVVQCVRHVFARAGRNAGLHEPSQCALCEREDIRDAKRELSGEMGF